MLLTYIAVLLHILKCTLSFIENNSVLVGVIASVMASTLWFGKYIKQKRAEAFFGFYAQLSLRIKTLQTDLEVNDRLNIIDPEVGNIYSLVYAETLVKQVCPKFKSITDEELIVYVTAAKELKSFLLESSNNVYPHGTTQQEWYKSQQVLLSFCEFLTNEKVFYYMTNKEFEKGEVEPKHITKCKALINSMNFILNSIDRAKY